LGLGEEAWSPKGLTESLEIGERPSGRFSTFRDTLRSQTKEDVPRPEQAGREK